MNDNNWWLLVFLLIAGNPGAMEKIEEEMKTRKQIEEQRNMCHHVEWEQDMSMRIPFCKLDGKICNMQCVKGGPK